MTPFKVVSADILSDGSSGIFDVIVLCQVGFFILLKLQNQRSIIMLSAQRLCQSIMAVRYKKPRLIGIYVMSIDHAWFGIICHSAN